MATQLGYLVGEWRRAVRALLDKVSSVKELQLPMYTQLSDVEGRGEPTDFSARMTVG